MKKRAQPLEAFTLVEVVIALGVFAFAMVAIIGLFSLGMTTSRQSSDQIQASNLASLLLATRRASPTNSAIANFPIPALAATPLSNSTPIQVAINGTTVTSGMPASDIFNLNYVILPGATPNLSVVRLLLWQPATALMPPTNSPGACYEVATQIAHP
jgi:type II secretory pathway pseudopilin PulG